MRADLALAETDRYIICLDRHGVTCVNYDAEFKYKG